MGLDGLVVVFRRLGNLSIDESVRRNAWYDPDYL